MRQSHSTRPHSLVLAAAFALACAACEHKQSAKPLDAVASAKKAEEDRKAAAAQGLTVTAQGGCLVPGVFCTEFAGSTEAELAKLRQECAGKGSWVVSCQHDGAKAACKVTEGAATTVSWFAAGMSVGEARLQCNNLGKNPQFFEL